MRNGADNSDRNERSTRLVAQILRDEAAGQEALYEEFERGVRLFFAGRLRSEDVEDKVQDTFVAVVTAIRGGQLREPVRLAGFVRTIALRQLAGYVAETARWKTEPLESVEYELPGVVPSAEHETARRQRIELALRIFRALPEVDRQILRRFYLEDQPLEQICEALHITKTQFRLRKNRAKQRFAELTREAMERRKPVDQLFLRKGAASGH